MKNHWIILIAVVIIALFGAFFIRGQDSSPTTGKIVSDGKVQVVKLYVENGKYVLNPSAVQKDIPVRIEADVSRMPGCSKSLVIPAFNVRKTVSERDNIIEFTPTKAGTFNIACSMYMYLGTFTVLDDNGTNSNYVEEAPAEAGGSCGTSGTGGCGCGG